MQYWLIKSEPYVFSWQQLIENGFTIWDGVRNYTARNNLKAMKKGDLCFFYHSNEGLCIVGIASVSKEFFKDPTADDERWVSVEVKPYKKLATPLTLAQIKADDNLQEMQLIKQQRLSVSSVSAKEFKYILKLSKTKL